MTDSEVNDSKPKRSIWVRVDRYMRSLHLYTGLFLIPWVLVYAASAFLINHGATLREWLDLKPPRLEILREVEFTPADSFPEKQDEQAVAILTHLDLDGAHRVMVAQSNARQLKVLRMCAIGNYVVTWNRPDKKITLQQQQPFSYLRFINYLHFKGGYGQKYPAHMLWAVVVDVVALSMAFWVVSGIYLWVRRPTKRLLGGLFFLGGSALFIALVLALSL